MNTENDSISFIKRIAGTPEDFRGFNIEIDELACQLEENGLGEQEAFRASVQIKTSEILVEQGG